jgi:translation initiation factor IF-2
MPDNRTKRQPIVAIVGHIDHGKSTLLDYIRKTNVVEGEAGGITQHLSAYEIEHTSSNSGTEKKESLTFLDTPGHAAFQKMRARGLEVADVAILVVSAEEGVKPQTLEAVKLIQQEKVPYIVALTKIDKPSANLDRAKSSLIENEIYIEGMGGDIPFVAVSGKSGEGIPELLDLIVLSAELAELTYDAQTPATGSIIEANVDNRKGISATLILREGCLQSGSYIVAGESIAPVRIMENFLGKPIKEAHAGQPVRIIGFSSVPTVGGAFRTVKNKKEAEAAAEEERRKAPKKQNAVYTASDEETARPILPLVIKADVVGTIDAIGHEIEKIPAERIELRMVSQGVGNISEADVKQVAGSSTPGIILGFNVKVDGSAKDLAERMGVTIETFDIIYKLAEWLAEEAVKRTPKAMVEEVHGRAKILKIFSESKNGFVLGGRVEEGELTEGAQLKILRRDIEVGRGHVGSLQSQKAPVKRVEAGNEFGALIETKDAPAAGDYIVAFSMIEK